MKTWLVCLFVCIFSVTSVMADDYQYFGASANDGGKPHLVIGKTIPDDYSKQLYPFLISIYWEYISDNDVGMPDDETLQLQLKFDDLVENLDRDGISHQVLIRTGHGLKEWHWYVKDKVDWMNRFNLALKDHASFPIEIEVEHQPDWDFYQQFMDQLQSPETEAASALDQ